MEIDDDLDDGSDDELIEKQKAEAGEKTVT